MHIPGLEIYDVLLLRLFAKKKVARAFLSTSKCGKTPIYIVQSVSLSTPWRAVERLSCLCKIPSTKWGSLGNKVSSILKAEST